MRAKSPPESQATIEAAHFALQAFDGKCPELWDLSFDRSGTTADTPIGIALENLRRCWGHDRTYAERRRIRQAANTLRKTIDDAFPPHHLHWQTVTVLAVVSAVAIFVLYRTAW